MSDESNVIETLEDLIAVLEGIYEASGNIGVAALFDGVEFPFSIEEALVSEGNGSEPHQEVHIALTIEDWDDSLEDE